MKTERSGVSVQANARVSGRYAGTTSLFSMLAAAFLLSGCINLHVYFPSAPADRAAEEQKPQGGGEKK